jgi:hypothetical protein
MFWLIVRNVLRAAIAEEFVIMLVIAVLPLLVRENERDIPGYWYRQTAEGRHAC